MNTCKLTDTAIAHIAKLLQLAILTGTDIVDHLRLLELANVDGELHLSPDYSENFEKGLQRMQDELPQKVNVTDVDVGEE